LNVNTFKKYLYLLSALKGFNISSGNRPGGGDSIGPFLIVRSLRGMADE
jgi:hypothetical protein